MSNHSQSKCTACGSTHVESIIKIKDVPAHCALLWDEKQKAINCPKGDIELSYCKDCGHLYNSDFNPEIMEYTQDYDNSLHFSQRFQQYSTELIEDLTKKYNLHQKDLVEIGCGKGDFLKMICEYGDNRGYGFDKSYDPANEESAVKNTIEFIQDFYGPEYANYPADMVMSRYVLEHIQFPIDFLKGIKEVVLAKNENSTFYFEVPNILFTLRDLSIWDLIYEHCSYFSATSLARLFENEGFKVNNVYENYGGQFLGIEADTKSNSKESFKAYINIAEIDKMVAGFTKAYDEKISFWTAKLDELKQENKKVVAWGGGAKGVSFLNFLPTTGFVNEIVDINPRKRGKFIAGTGQLIVSPEDLKELKPDVIVLMNPIYKDEISDVLNATGLTPEILVL